MQYVNTPDGTLTAPIVTGPPVYRTYAKGIAYLNGVCYIGWREGGDIYNSAFNDPSTWTGDFIGAAVEQDTLEYLTDVGNHVVAFGSETIQFFYDAGNPTGSPLLPRQDIIYRIGIPPLQKTAVRNYTPPVWSSQLSDYVAFIGRTLETKSGVFILHSSLALEEVSTPEVARIISTDAGAYMSGIVFDGQEFLIVTASGYTLVYNVTAKLWHHWQTESLGKEFPCGPIAQSFLNGYDGNFNSSYMMIGGQNRDSVIYGISPDAHQDYNAAGTIDPITLQIQTRRLIGNSPHYQSNRKYHKSLNIIADRGTTSPRNVQVQTSDDDYETWTTARDLDIQNPAVQLNNLGSFYERAVKVTDTENLPLRILKMESEITTGFN